MSVRTGKGALRLKKPSNAELRRIGSIGNATQSRAARRRAFNATIPF